MAIFRFYCDESYDGSPSGNKRGAPHEPISYVVAGFFADQKTWERVEKRWHNKNTRVRVPRFHAAHLNAGTWEFADWSKSRRVRYSRDMLHILKDQKKKLHAVSCGMYADDYRRIINDDGRIRLGHPYLVCFKACIATIAKGMRDFPPDDKFAVILDRNGMDAEAVKIFYGIKDNPAFPDGSRLATCTPGSTEDFIGLQPADLIAYETFKLMHGKRNGSATIRRALASMFGKNAFLGYQIGAETLCRFKEAVEAVDCIPGGFVIVPPYFEEESNAKGD